MGKAFTEEERVMVQEKLRRAGLKLFREKGIKGVSIRQLTSAAGIAQGGFYTFYKDKTDFLLDIIEFRIKEKLSDMAAQWDKSLEDPAGYLAEEMYLQGMHLTENKAFDNAISGTMELYQSIDKQTARRIRKLYKEYLEKLIRYWHDNGIVLKADIEGLLWSIRMESFMITNASFMDREYMAKIFKSFCKSVVDDFIKVG
ncbi:MAG: TetR/AcrR family transcriptional regulator [Lachnospiraceae bacterium]|nr:TetR/AcrR family transcriptional regulator [Lachnospiraceae bacterium]